MLETTFLITAFIGSTLAGIIDLKTTEIPDEIPYTMMGIGIAGHLIQAYSSWSYSPIAISVMVGLGFLIFGFFMYYMGQWGGGDAKLLSSIGFLLPTLSHRSPMQVFPFPLSYFFNVFLVGSVYIIIYSIILSFINKKILVSFIEELKANLKEVLVLSSFFMVFIILVFVFVSKHLEIFSVFMAVKSGFFMTLGILCFFFVWKFMKTVEDVGFKRKIPVSSLKPGDVLLESKVWEGITEKEVERIKNSGKKYVWIKEGVRFAPVFPLSLLFTVFVGDGIVLLFNLL